MRYSDPFIDHMLLLTGWELLFCQCWRNYLLSSQHITDILQWNIRGIVLRISNDSFSELFLLLSKIWWWNIIDIREQLLEWRFFCFLCHLNRLQKLREEINKNWYTIWPSKVEQWRRRLYGKFCKLSPASSCCFWALTLPPRSTSHFFRPIFWIYLQDPVPFSSIQFHQLTDTLWSHQMWSGGLLYMKEPEDFLLVNLQGWY